MYFRAKFAVGFLLLLGRINNAMVSCMNRYMSIYVFICDILIVTVLSTYSDSLNLFEGSNMSILLNC